MRPCKLTVCMTISILTLLGIVCLVNISYFTRQFLLTTLKYIDMWRFSTINSACPLVASYLAEDGSFDLSLRYCVDRSLPATRCAKIPLNLISKKGGDRNVSFAEMAEVDDDDWKIPIKPDAYNMYPQGLSLPDVIQKYKETGFVPEIPINNPTLKILNASSSVCPPEGQNGGKYDLVVVMKSALYNFEDRQNIRRLYTHLRNDSVNSTYRVGIVFFVGLPSSAHDNVFKRDRFNITLPGRAGNSLINVTSRRAQILTQLDEEMRQYDDLVMGDFEETYLNLSLKMHLTFLWAAKFCRERPGFMFLDDDMAFNEKRLYTVLTTLPADWRRKIAISSTRFRSPTVRPNQSTSTLKWALTKREVPWPVHAPYANGYFYMLGYDHVADLSLAMFFTKPISIDDVWLGLVMHKLGLQFQLPKGVDYSLYHHTNVTGFIALPPKSLLSASVQKTTESSNRKKH